MLGNEADHDLWGNSEGPQAKARRRLGFRCLLLAYAAISTSWGMFWVVWRMTQ
jgi:hypothetical protein